MLAVSTKLPTPYGWTTVGTLVQGTTLFDEVGFPVSVTSVGEVHTEKVFRVGLTNKKHERGALLMTENQLLCTWDRDQMRELTIATGIKTIPTDWAEYDGVVRPLSEVRERFEVPDGKTRKLMHVIPVTFPLILPHRDVPVPPYIMGLAIHLHDPYTGLMTCKERMWDWYEKQFVSAGYPVSRTKKRLKRYRPYEDVTFSSAELNRHLSREHAYNRGLIPESYLRGSMQQRMELLQGLLDISFSDFNTHGDTYTRMNKRSSVMVWCDQNEKRHLQVLELVRSLGYAAIGSYHADAKSYTVRYCPVENPYRYPRFRAELADLTKLKRNTFTRFCWRIQSVELDSEAEVRSFEVTGPSGMVSASELFLPVVAGGDK